MLDENQNNLPHLNNKQNNLKSDLPKMINGKNINAESLHYVESIYQQYVSDNNSVDTDYKNYFKTFGNNTQSQGLLAKDIPKFSNQIDSKQTGAYKKFETNTSSIGIKTKNFSNQPTNQNGGNQITHSIEGTQNSRAIDTSQIELLQANADFNDEIQEAQINQDVLNKVRLKRLFNGYRLRGHRKAKIDPLDIKDGRNSRVPELDLSFYQFKKEDLDQLVNISSISSMKPSVMPLKDVIAQLEKTYANHFAAEIMHINDEERKKWLTEKIERAFVKDTLSKEEKISLLTDIVAADEFEKNLGLKYPGSKRFSLEGCDSFIPLMKRLISRSAIYYHTKQVVVGMAHRGRLNMLVNVMGKNPQTLFELFENKEDAEILNDDAFSGDVKYHQGYFCQGTFRKNHIEAALLFNPSHLEIVSPVVEGVIRARQDSDGTPFAKGKVIPIVIHGDAALAGQGVVMETLQLVNTRAFTTGGSIHIVINNQIGFTTSYQQDARSTVYCTDVFKMVDAPVFHVNADDPEAVIKAVDIAIDYRMRYNQDIIIDLIGYRRKGHNEADEPAVTQPYMYSKIKKHRPCQEIYSQQLINQNIINQDDYKKIIDDYKSRLNTETSVSNFLEKEPRKKHFAIWDKYTQKWTDQTVTKPNSDVKILAEEIFRPPTDFKLHKVVDKIYANRLNSVRVGVGIDWGCAENLAYATLVKEGYSIRFTGQDVGRGTFAHRHAIVYNVGQGERYIPIRELQKKNPNYGSFEIYDSLLSEEAVLGFEYGYSIAMPETLTIWEAQFGDFMNGAQVVIDQFISSGEQKWKSLSGLTMLLPHGFEGSGPEHSSGRIERFLQLCAYENMQVCIPTLPSQIFHLLRRQIIQKVRKPLIIFTPKSLLRHKKVISKIEDLNEGVFHTIIDDNSVVQEDIDKVKRIILCSGKIYYDLSEHKLNNNIKDIAIIRVEQLYPFPTELLKELIKKYQVVNEVFWVQEEPINQGAWFYVYKKLTSIFKSLELITTLDCVARNESSSPAVGNAAFHKNEQQNLVLKAFAK